jgi:uncharacterized protein (DUF2062 family)
MADLFGILDAPPAPRQKPVPAAAAPRPAPESDRLAQCLAAHRALTRARALAQQAEEELARATASPHTHAAGFAAHAAVQIGGAVIALGNAVTLNGADAHDALLGPAEPGLP